MHDTPPLLRFRLSVMMFLQYGIWGAWIPILYPYLTGELRFDEDQCGSIMAGGAIGAIFGPFVAGQVADRFFATEKFLGISHLAGAALIYSLTLTTDYRAFLVLSVLFGVVYAPTLALTNSLAFHHLPKGENEFGRIRLWGTIGWIAASIAMGQWLAINYTPAAATAAEIKIAQDAGRADAFVLSAVLGLAMAIFSFTLPHTPPIRNAAEPNAAAKAMRAFLKQPLITIFCLAIPVSCIHQFQVIFTSEFLSTFERASDNEFARSINRVLGVGGGGLMTIGQMTEILVLAALPAIATRVPRKTLLALGLLCYATRAALFVYGGSLPLVLLGVALHGPCFGFFIVACFMIIDEETPKDVRASAQNLFHLVIIGIGIIVGSWVSTSVVGKWAKEGTTMNWAKLFEVPMWASVVCLAALLAFYPNRRRAEEAVA
jgi:nucleoside transporter